MAEHETISHQKTVSEAIHGQRHSFLLAAAAQTPFVQRFLSFAASMGFDRGEYNSIMSAIHDCIESVFGCVTTSMVCSLTKKVVIKRNGSCCGRKKVDKVHIFIAAHWSTLAVLLTG